MRVTMRTQRAAFLSPETMRRKGPAVSGTDLQNRINRMATCLPVLGMGDYGVRWQSEAATALLRDLQVALAGLKEASRSAPPQSTLASGRLRCWRPCCPLSAAAPLVGRVAPRAPSVTPVTNPVRSLRLCLYV
jgi:hypothetical protein